MGGVSAIVSPTTILSGFSADPLAFLARSVTSVFAGGGDRPGDPAGLGIERQPGGRGSAAKVIGRSPVAGIV